MTKDKQAKLEAKGWRVGSREEFLQPIVTADEAVGGPHANDTALSGNVRLKITNGVDPLK